MPVDTTACDEKYGLAGVTVGVPRSAKARRGWGQDQRSDRPLPGAAGYGNRTSEPVGSIAAAAPVPPGLAVTLAEQRDFMKLHASHVSVSDFDDQYFEVSFNTQDPGDDFDLSAPLQPYLLVQRQFEDDDGGVCYIETHDPDTYAGHFRLHLVEFTPTRLVFEIDRPNDRIVEVSYTLDATRFREIQHIVHIIFGVQGCAH